jgi:hypothetical protein
MDMLLTLCGRCRFEFVLVSGCGLQKSRGQQTEELRAGSGAGLE